MKNIFASYLELLTVKHTKKFSEKYFNEHPHKYNLYGLSQMLSEYGIENAGTKIEDKENDIYRIETPFIAHTQVDFVIVYKIENGKVFYIWQGIKVDVLVEEFMKMWTGIVLLTEKSEKSIEPNYKEHKTKDLLHFSQYILLIVSALSLFLLTYITNKLYTSLGLNSLLFVNLIGVFIGCLLVLKQMNFHGGYVDKICSLFSKGDCNNVLESDAAKLFGVFGWSEIGLGYFAANVLTILFLPKMVLYLAIINLFALPYAFWSVWYQKFKAKQWCPLCLATQVVLWLIFGVNLIFGYLKIVNFSFIDLILTGSIFAIIILIINILVPNLSKDKQTENIKYEINSIKANEDVFKILLLQQTKFEVSKENSQIFLGNPDALLKVTIFTNPYCYPCAKMHNRVEKLLKDTNNEISIQYIFSAFNSDLENVNRYLIAAYLQKEKETRNQIFRDWFEKGKPLGEKFFDNFDLNIKTKEVEDEFKRHEEWKEKAGVRGTPTVFVNGYELPDNYKIEDLRWFLEFDVN